MVRLTISVAGYMKLNSDGVAVDKTCQDRIDDLVVVAGGVVVVLSLIHI